MSVPERYQRPDSWPHLFSPAIGPVGGFVEKPYMTPTGPVIAKLYKCTHCSTPWWQGIDQRPMGACPKRVDVIEQRRLRGMI